jgi:hypothetical protein
MKSICQQCNKEYEAERRTSKFCGDKCRQQSCRDKYSVTKSSDSVSVTDVVIDDYNVLVEDRVKGSTKKCAGCGDTVHPLVCICHNCIKNGITHRTLGLTCHEIDYPKNKESI